MQCAVPYSKRQQEGEGAEGFGYPALSGCKL